MLKLNIKDLTNNITLWGLFLVVPLLISYQLLDQGLLIRLLGVQLLLILSLIVLAFSSKNNNFPLSGLSITYLLLIIYSLVQLLFSDKNGDAIFDVIREITFFILFIILLTNFSKDRFRRDFIRSFSLLSLILSVWGCVEIFSLLQHVKISIPLDTYQVKLIYGHRNLYSQLLFLLLPFVFYSALTTKSRFWKITNFTTILISVFILISLSNRTTWISLAASFIIITLFLLLKRHQLSINFRPLLIVVGIGLIANLLFFKFFTVGSDVGTHFEDIVNPDKGSGKDRTELWKRSFKIIEEKSIFGIGPAKWKIEMLKYGNKGLVSEDNITFYQRPHNDFLWIASEYGIVGFLIYTSIFLLAFISLIKQINSEKIETELIFKLSILFSLIAYFIYSNLSFPHERIVSNLIFVFLLANIASGEKQSTRMNIKKFVLVFFLLLITLSTFFTINRYVAEYHTCKILNAKNKGDFTVVLSECQKVNTFYYPCDPFSTPIYWYEGLAYYNKGDYKQAENSFEEAFSINPYHVHVLNNLASASINNHDIEKGINLYKKTLTIYPDFEETKLNLSAVYFNKNELDSALVYIKKIDQKTTNKKYKTFLKAILYKIIADELGRQNREDEIQYLPQEADWYFNLLKGSIDANTPIKNYIFESSELKKIHSIKNNNL